MGQRQSQLVSNFLSNNISSTNISQVIQNYATSTNAVSTNTQNLNVSIQAGNILPTSTINVKQRIQSYINVNNLVDRTNTTELTASLQQAATNDISSSLTRITDGLADILPNLFAGESKQEFITNIQNNLSTYVNQVVNESTVDELLLSSSNVQNGTIVLNAQDIAGNLNFTQEIQSEVMGENIVKAITNVILASDQVQQLENNVQSTATDVAESPITSLTKGGAGTLVLIIGAIIGLLFIIAGAVVAFAGPSLFLIPPKTAIIIGAIVAVIGLIIGGASLAYFFINRANNTTAAAGAVANAR